MRVWKKLKKPLAAVLAVAMVTSAVPTAAMSAYAVEETMDENNIEAEEVIAKTAEGATTEEAEEVTTETAEEVTEETKEGEEETNQAKEAEAVKADISEALKAAAPSQDTTYTYDFTKGEIITGTINTFTTADGLMTINGGNNLYYHGEQHGIAVYNDNTFEISVAGNAIITFLTCKYANGTIEASCDETKGQLSKKSISAIGAKDGAEAEFKYKGEATVLTFKVVSGDQSYIHGITVENTSKELDITQWAKKDFSISIGDKTIDVTGADSEDADSKVSLSDGNVYYQKSENAYISTQLNGMLSAENIQNNTPGIVKDIEVNNSGDIIINFADETTNPKKYTIKMQDASKFTNPVAGTAYTYDFTSSAYALPKEFDAQTKVTDKYMTDDGILTLSKGEGNDGIYNNGSHGIILCNGNTIAVKVAGNASISFNLCQHSNPGSIQMKTTLSEGESCTYYSDNIKGNACNDTITFTYTGAAKTLEFFVQEDGRAYIHQLTVKNENNNKASAVKNPQEKMPTIINTDMVSITPIGHRIYMSNAQNEASIASVSNDNGYYLFDLTNNYNTLEADVKLTLVGNKSQYGISAGVFSKNAENIKDILTVALRRDKSVRNIYSKSTGEIGAGGINTTYKTGESVHIKIKRNKDKVYFMVKNEDGTVSEKEVSFSSTKIGANEPLSFGFCIANADAVVTNLCYTDTDGKILYDQNECYEAVGKAPEIRTINKPEISQDRLSLSVSFEADDCADDGMYKVELSKDGGKTYECLSSAVTDKKYVAAISESGAYKFRISGVCGTATSNAIESESIILQAPLNETKLSAVSGDSKITLSWLPTDGATRYEIYRKSTEEKEYSLIATETGTSYEDTGLTNETPLYYYIICKSDTNTSNGCEPILTVPSAGHKGEYVYDEEAVKILITKKSYDTVYTNKAVIEGVAEEAGKLSLVVNENVQKEISVGNKGRFAFEAQLNQGRNDINILHTNKEGNVTRKKFNFVYLTNYDYVVDAKYTGNDGDELSNPSGIKVYKTVQAAVNAIPDSNADRKVILVKAGNYVEHLQINKPNITLIGEDRDAVNISFFDATESPVGGDTSKRCAVYVTQSAGGFLAENLTFENTYNYLGDGSISNESADALRVDADKAAFVNVKLMGYQDTLQANTNHSYFSKCQIWGNIDYIYGNGMALFDDCELIFRYNANKNSGYITAPKTPKDAGYGYIFNNCQVMAQAGCGGSKYLLARPWGPDGAAAFINTYMSSIINKNLPYSDMSGNSYSNARFVEYYTYGKGFAINTDRPQISKAQAEEMLSVESLGWDPYQTVKQYASKLVGNVVTNVSDGCIENEYISDTADPDSTNDEGLGMYSISGYADAAKTTGGGLLLETSKNYYKVSDAEEFLDAVMSVKKSGEKSVIEITDDIALGANEIGDLLTKYSGIITSAITPILHPTLIKTGVSRLSLKEMSNLTIFSKNGSSILHTCIIINASSNIIIKNIKFDELWEWDEDHGEYDRNDWDYITIENGSNGIWIDHCTFYKAYDGIVDVKKADSSYTTNVTISWCRFLPESENSTFFNEMMTVLEQNPSKYKYYNSLINDYKMTKEQVRGYASGQKKTHLIGASDTEANYENLNLTLAYNYYKDSMDRMPRLRGGNAHVYNCIMDATELYNLKKELMQAGNQDCAAKIVSNGSLSTCNAHVLVQNTYMTNILCPVQSGNAASPGGYINALDSLYNLEGSVSKLGVTDYAGEGKILDTKAFISALPYKTPLLYGANKLHENVMPYTGAGVVSMDGVQWLKSKYNDANNSTNDNTDNSINDNTNDNTDNSINDSINDSTDNDINDNTDDSTDNDINDNTDDSTENDTNDNTDDSTDNNTNDNTDNSANDNTNSNTNDSTNNTIEEKVSGIRLDKNNVTTGKGTSVKLSAVTEPSNASGKDIIWTSSNTGVASVDENGNVTGVSYGEAVITAALKDNANIMASCKVNVGYKITYKLDGGKNSSDNPAYIYKTEVKLDAPSKKGYNFEGWYADSKYKKELTKIKKTQAKNITVYAKWEKITKPSKVELNSVKGSSKKLKINLTKLKGVKGYEIVYAKDKKFKSEKNTLTVKNVSSKTISGIKAGKYYIKVRAYKVDSDGNKIYGKYSKTLSATVKK